MAKTENHANRKEIFSSSKNATTLKIVNKFHRNKSGCSCFFRDALWFSPKYYDIDFVWIKFWWRRKNSASSTENRFCWSTWDPKTAYIHNTRTHTHTWIIAMHTTLAPLFSYICECCSDDVDDDNHHQHHHYILLSLNNQTSANFNFIQNAFYPHAIMGK